MNGILSFSRSIPVKPVSPFRAKTGVRKSPAIIFARLEDSQQQQLNLSVLRFTLGIPGLDESYLPRWIGYGLGSLLLLNHFVDSGSTTIIPAQLGAQPAFQRVQPDGAEQIFVMSPNLAGIQKEDLAWASYVLLRNTNAIAALISIQGDICIRGYWNVPAENSSKESLLGWFQEKVEKAGLFDLKDTLYFPQEADSEFQELLPKGACSVLVQPLLQVSSQPANGPQNPEGFILLASTVTYAFSVKDRAWIAAAANKFSGTSRLTNL
ncbi:protein COFACTOR ASSEMBLY OF COMPLEX C SUBUNIT B CCB2, chloroplastic isoform X2 [Prosopis cineraria]|uniref:protein COFACTOR ASSEMBLY OF COMPLEX C SUBUNIT B CCB2, chloroplastic isoform X2 n=1 Tax=Prosopis cineraria TaxID=364024 RepID=UPI00240ED809|nr:protein COFACTOR ASSEMBLY OF COMPLEX C SUBUNIT B CCB2, chloroplastic isoform X2 [Prosopis cineraria]